MCASRQRVTQKAMEKEAKLKVSWYQHGPTCQNCVNYRYKVKGMEALYKMYAKGGAGYCIKYGFTTYNSAWCTLHAYKEGAS